MHGPSRRLLRLLLAPRISTSREQLTIDRWCIGDGDAGGARAAMVHRSATTRTTRRDFPQDPVCAAQDGAFRTRGARDAISLLHTEAESKVVDERMRRVGGGRTSTLYVCAYMSRSGVGGARRSLYRWRTRARPWCARERALIAPPPRAAGGGRAGSALSGKHGDVGWCASPPLSVRLVLDYGDAHFAFNVSRGKPPKRFSRGTTDQQQPGVTVTVRLLPNHHKQISSVAELTVELAVLVRSNGVPTDAQALQLEHLVEAGKIELCELEQTSMALSLVLETLRVQSLRKTESLDTLNGVLSVFRRFPVEILGEIFFLAVCADARKQHRWNSVSIADPHKAPVVLGQVCSHWRMVSQSLPKLWTLVAFPASTVVEPDTALMVSDILARSRNLPLSLSVLSHTWWLEMPRPGNSDFFRILSTSYHRLHTFALEITQHQLAHCLPPTVLDANRTFPRLEFLSLTIEHNSLGPADIGSLLDFFQYSPILHSLDLTMHERPSTTPLALCSFPWSRLTHLRICMGIPLTQVRDVLAQCRVLESARVLIGSHPGPALGPQSRHTLPRLRELHFAVQIDASTTLLFESFSFPNLKALALDIGYLSPDTFNEFATRSGFQLHYFSVERLNDLYFDDLFIFLQSQPTIETLHVVNCRVCNDPRLFRIFTHHPMPTWPRLALPELRKLTLELDHELDGTAAADMAEYLIEHAGEGSPFPKLEHVHLMAYSSEPEARYEDAVEERLAAIVASGFVIREEGPGLDDMTAYIKDDGPRWK
ncbi:hypothetical protein DFH06DRAFT_1307192 [Mycena polygramma]|nr:hypothetical protein DFH06DRAFT_1307192 [Mycena polygramma]